MKKTKKNELARSHARQLSGEGGRIVSVKTPNCISGHDLGNGLVFKRETFAKLPFVDSVFIFMIPLCICF